MRVSASELLELEERAEGTGQALSAYVREAALGRDLPRPLLVPELNRRAWLELSRHGSNLNQLTKQLHERHLLTPPMAEQVLDELASTQRKLEEVRVQLLGGDLEFDDDPEFDDAPDAAP